MMKNLCMVTLSMICFLTVVSTNATLRDSQDELRPTTIWSSGSNTNGVTAAMTVEHSTDGIVG